jgi:hypothetical protein
LDPSQQEYQGFRCGDSSPTFATISTRGTDEIVLKDISNESSLDLSFQLPRQRSIQLRWQQGYGRVSVSIDGKKLDAVTAPGKESQLFLGSMDSIFNIDSTVTQTFATDTYTITQTFDIYDNYSNVHISKQACCDRFVRR